MIATTLLRRKATTSESLIWEPAVWSLLVMAEVKEKLLSEEDKQHFRRLARRLREVAQ